MKPALDALAASGVGAGDLVLLVLVLGIASLALYGQVKASSELSVLRRDLERQEGGLAAAQQAEKEAAVQLKRLIDHQRANQARIQFLRSRRNELSHLPYGLEQEAESLSRWCQDQNLIVRDEQREAMKDPAARRT